MKGRSVAALVALVVAGIAAVAWIALKEPEAPAVGGAGAVEDAAPPETAGKKAAIETAKRPRAGSGTRWTRRGAGTVAGRVREYGTDRALGGISLTIEAGTPGPDRTIEATTAADGSFVVQDVDEFDGWTLRAKAPAPLADAELAGVRVRTGAQTDVGTVYLAPAFAVPGIVVDDRGAPVEGAEVLAARRSAADAGRIDILRILRELPQRPAAIDRAKTGADGRFRLTRLVPGTYGIAAQRAGFATTIEDSVVVTPASAARELRIVVRKGLEARGRVTRKGGAAAAGVTVVAFPEPRGTSFIDPFGKSFATTDETGAFRLEGLVPARYIVAAAPEGEPSSINEKVRVPAAGLIEITLDGDATLEGTVTGPDDKPVAGAQVLVMSEKAKSFATAVTDDAGRYAMKGLASGHPTAVIVSAEGFARHPADISGSFRGKDPETNLVPGANRKDVKLAAGATVRGNVREKGTGTVAAGVRVQVVDGAMGMVLGAARGATTDAEGRYTIAGVAEGTVVLTLTKEGWYQPDVTQETMMSTMGMQTGAPTDTGPVIVVAADAALVERDLEISRLGTIRGRVDAPDGSPAADAQVSIVSEGREDPFSILGAGVEPRLTDATGAFSMAAPAPGRTVRLVAKRGDLAPGRSDPVTGAAGTDLDGVVVRLRLPAVLDGRVTDSDGKPVEGALVRWTVAGSRDGPSASTDADGRWHAGNVEPATYAVQFTHPRYLAWTAKDTVVDEGKTVTVDALLTLGAVVTGKVVGPDGNAVAGAIVDLVAKSRRGDMEQRDPIVSGADGSFRAEGLAAGAYWASARAEGFVASDRVDVDAPAGAVTLRLAQAFTISGIVRMRGGGPVALVDVRAQAPRPGAAPAVHTVPAAVAPGDGKIPAPGIAKSPMFTATGRTDADGRFVVKGLPAGAYELRVDLDGRAVRPNVLPASVAGVTAGQSGVVIEMEPGLVISGEVVLDGGGPAAGGRVSCTIERQKGAPNVDGGRGSAVIAAGRFEIVGLAPGTYDVTVNVDEHAPKRMKAASGATGLRVQLSRGGTISGRALLPDGSAAGGASVSASSPEGNGSGKADADGRFTVRFLAEGTYDLSVWYSGREQPQMRYRASGVAVQTGTPTEVGDVTCVKVEKPAPPSGRVPIPPPPTQPPK